MWTMTEGLSWQHGWGVQHHQHMQEFSFLSDFPFRFLSPRECARQESELDKRVSKTRECTKQESMQEKRVC